MSQQLFPIVILGTIALTLGIATTPFLGAIASLFCAIIFFYWYWAYNGLSLRNRLSSDLTLPFLLFRFVWAALQFAPQVHTFGFSAVCMIFPIAVISELKPSLGLDIDLAQAKIITYTYVVDMSWKQATGLLKKDSFIYISTPKPDLHPSDAIITSQRNLDNDTK